MAGVDVSPVPPPARLTRLRTWLRPGWELMWWAVGVLMVGTLCLPPASTGSRLGIRRVLSPEVAAEWRVGQRFTMNARNFTALELRAAAVGPVGGSYRLTLRDAATGEVERTADAQAADLVRAGSYTFQFAPIAFSADRPYEFEIAPSPGQPGHGVAFRATRGERADGGMLINGVRRWASLAFEARTTAEAPIWALGRPPDPGRPPRWIALVALAAGWVALRIVLRSVAELSSDRVLAR